VESYRKGVDAARRAEALASGAQADEHRPWARPPLRSWTDAEHAEFERLHDAAGEAVQARHAALAASGLGAGYEVVQELHAAAWAGSPRS
jgi:hypothetical protein